jgi:hypothetical protein
MVFNVCGCVTEEAMHQRLEVRGPLGAMDIELLAAHDLLCHDPEQ